MDAETGPPAPRGFFHLRWRQVCEKLRDWGYTPPPAILTRDPATMTREDVEALVAGLEEGFLLAAERERRRGQGP